MQSKDNHKISGNGVSNKESKNSKEARMELVETPLLPAGYKVPKSRWTHPSTRMRELLESESYLFGPGIYDPLAGLGADVAREGRAQLPPAVATQEAAGDKGRDTDDEDDGLPRSGEAEEGDPCERKGNC